MEIRLSYFQLSTLLIADVATGVMQAATVERQREITSQLVTRGHTHAWFQCLRQWNQILLGRAEIRQSQKEGLKEADSAACGKEHVKLGQQPHLGIQPAEWKRQKAPAVHMEEGNPIPARPQTFIYLFIYSFTTTQTGEYHKRRNIGATAQPLNFAPSFAVDIVEWKR